MYLPALIHDSGYAVFEILMFPDSGFGFEILNLKSYKLRERLGEEELEIELKRSGLEAGNVKQHVNVSEEMNRFRIFYGRKRRREMGKKKIVLRQLKQRTEPIEPEGRVQEESLLIGDALVQGSIIGVASEMPERYMQAVVAGTGVSAIFPKTYSYKNLEDDSLGPEGDLRVYLEGLALAENVQEYVKNHPFGQRPINNDPDQDGSDFPNL
ncbi:hypothetical protein POM88_037153 [Heracleum sosnowskyi]|uniref:Uncharacterized protein n=1 Tax=Heracleum sosnowskyi TaxID=360622 RepID=A0AAD8HPT5_9APIA|nr:hypothetical protein POM88_037153 [Heracleum sosnowskyi]